MRTLLFVVALAAASPSPGAEAVKDQCRGWSSTALRNGLVKVQVVPEIGGRIMQFSLGDAEFLWVNPSLAGKTPPPSGLGPDKSWLNYGGDKLWPAPQGWDNDQQWPGPPDAVLDGQPYRSQVSKDGQGVAVRLESGKDLRSGIQFARTIRLFDGTTRVAFEATMTNIDAKPRRWGIWSHTQLDGAAGQGVPNTKLIAYCPINPASHFPKGYRVIFGAADNPSFQRDAQGETMRVQYQYQVGKIGLDSHAGWVATVDGTKGAVFVQRFVFEPKQEYPDGSSVEFWHNGRGSFRAWGKDNVMKDDPKENPCVFESELISPFARLQPGAELHLALRLVCGQYRRRFPDRRLQGLRRDRRAAPGESCGRRLAVDGPVWRVCRRRAADRVARRPGPRDRDRFPAARSDALETVGARRRSSRAGRRRPRR